ncbi:MAG TPA: hypothetical protein VFP61_00950 [Acidimicrobiales bacterium]|nr:hypothetical protein [Acidimicrobiales bacterium]
MTRLCAHGSAPVTFTPQPGEATCPACVLEQYLTATGVQGRYPGRWEPSGYGRR